MRPLRRLFGVTVLSALAWCLTRPVPTVHAWQLGACADYDRTTENPCASCCLGGTIVSNVTDDFVNGPGTEILVSQYMDCGTSGSCIGGNAYCQNFSYEQAIDDPADCCLPSGTPCNQGTCCSGLICLSDNTCGQCIQDGTSCSSNTDCCSGFCNPDTNTCGELCGLTDAYCSVDSDCCSYFCNGGYCE